ncbi:hypothetical protein M011DRAFT_480617 [Sporormia fimetaria CBS 119925]|uniref:BTB domain-containing protein n=1 Tax=Sporormia fimetaria CBS 119925 TaxID=1340428 RepID=A0A6A6V1Q6_9PLEO|nr:hypothetical protein M011DRAFT_480617 [Sporormia fimetaria CBS 119925]
MSYTKSMTPLSLGSVDTSTQSDCTTTTDLTTQCTIHVGTPSTPFTLHSSLLIKNSPYFRAALTGPFQESTTQTITLPDIHPSTFELLVTYLYTRSISPLPFKDSKPAYYTLLHLYILADRLCIESLRNTIVDTIADLADDTNSVLTPSDTRILYEQIPPHAPIRSLVLDLFAFKKTDKLLAEHEDRWHAGFLRDLVVLLKRPCPQAMLRHKLSMWYAASYDSAALLACENCRTVLPPRFGAVRCEECGVAWCKRCVGEGTGMAGWEDGSPGRMVRVRRGDVVHGGRDTGAGGRESADGDSGYDDGWESAGEGGLVGRKMRVRKWMSCKPWRGSRCAVYHEHRETERCAEMERRGRRE